MPERTQQQSTCTCSVTGRQLDEWWQHDIDCPARDRMMPEDSERSFEVRVSIRYVPGWPVWHYRVTGPDGFEDSGAAFTRRGAKRAAHRAARRGARSVQHRNHEQTYDLEVRP